MTKYTFDASQIPNITWKTLDDLYQKGNADCVAMYLKYCYHANIQGTNQVYANLTFMTGKDEEGQKIKGGLGWGLDKTRKVRQQLVGLGYIELLPQENTSKHGEFGKTYTRVNHLVTRKKMETALLNSSSPVQVTDSTEGGEKPYKYLKDNHSKFLKDDNWEASPPQPNPSKSFVGENTISPRLDNSELRYTEPLSFDEIEQIAEVMARYPITSIDTREQRERTISWAKSKGAQFNSRQHFINAIKKGLENWYLKKYANNPQMQIRNDGWATEEQVRQWRKKAVKYRRPSLVIQGETEEEEQARLATSNEQWLNEKASYVSFH